MATDGVGVGWRPWLPRDEQEELGGEAGKGRRIYTQRRTEHEAGDAEVSVIQLSAPQGTTALQNKYVSAVVVVWNAHGGGLYGRPLGGPTYSRLVHGCSKMTKHTLREGVLTLPCGQNGSTSRTPTSTVPRQKRASPPKTMFLSIFEAYIRELQYI